MDKQQSLVEQVVQVQEKLVQLKAQERTAAAFLPLSSSKRLKTLLFYKRYRQEAAKRIHEAEALIKSGQRSQALKQLQGWSKSDNLLLQHQAAWKLIMYYANSDFLSEVQVGWKLVRDLDKRFAQINAQDLFLARCVLARKAGLMEMLKEQLFHLHKREPSLETFIEVFNSMEDQQETVIDHYLHNTDRQLSEFKQNSLSISENPQITVIVPVFHSEHMLEGSLDSIFNQTYPATQLIIADYTHTVDAASIAAKARRSFSFECICMQRNRRDLLTELAPLIIGELVTFQAVHQWSLPDRLQRQADWLLTQKTDRVTVKPVKVGDQLRQPKFDQNNGEVTMFKRTSQDKRDAESLLLTGLYMLEAEAGVTQFPPTPFLKEIANEEA